MNNIDFHKQTYDLLASIEEFKATANVLSQESLTNSFVNVIRGFFTKKLTLVKNAFNANITRTGTSNDYSRYLKALISLRSNIPKITEKLDMLEVGDEKVITIVGLRCDLLSLTKTLTKASALITTNLARDIAELDEIISKILSDENYRKAVKPISKIDTSYKKSLQDMLDATIDTRKFQDTDKISNLIPSLKSLGDIIENILIAGDGHTLEQYEELNKLVEGITFKSNDLIEMLKENPKLPISKQVYNHFVDKVTLVAEALTLSASFMHLINQSAIITKAIIEKLKMKL